MAGAGDPYSGAASELIGLIGAGIQGHSNSQKKQDLQNLMGDYQPDYNAYTENYFTNLSKYAPQAEKLSADIGNSELDTALAQREKALPGIGGAIQSGAEALFPLLRGELPPSILRAFNSSGAASSLGLGFGGSGFGALNTGLFGARGALGAMQTGYSLLGSLLSTMPRVNAPSTASFLNNIITPQQRVGDQLQFRQQQLGLGTQIAGMPSSADAWSNYVEGVAGVNAGQASQGGGMFGSFGGGGGGGNGTPGYQGSSGGSQYYNVPSNSIWGGGGAISGGWGGSTVGGFA